MSFTAATLVNAVRDLLPDPVYTGSTPQPDTDGALFRASTLYRWLDAGVRLMARALGAQILDWWAVQQVAQLPYYQLDAHFQTVDDAFVNLFPCPVYVLDEADTIWPSKATASQPLAAYVRRRIDVLEVGFFPRPNVADPTTTLTSAIAASGVDPIGVASVTGFLAYGFVLIDSELIGYQQVNTSGPSIGVITRGMGGTTPASHLINATVTHCGAWIRGTRSPQSITSSTSVVELPLDVVSLLEDFLLARCRLGEHETDEGLKLQQSFYAMVREMRADPTRVVNRWRISAYGEPALGPLYSPSLGGGIILR